MDSKEKERSSIDDVIDVYKKDVDMTLIRENLKLTPDQRLRQMFEFMEYVQGFRAGKLPLVRKWARLLRANQPGDERPKRLSNWRKYVLVQRAAGRPKDFDAIAELEALRDERDKI